MCQKLHILTSKPHKIIRLVNYSKKPEETCLVLTFEFASLLGVSSKKNTYFCEEKSISQL